MSERSSRASKPLASEEPVLDEALQWLVTLWSGEASDDERAACELWRRASPAHEAAWQRVQSIDKRLGALPAGVAASTLRGARAQARRRAVLRSLLFAGGTGALAWAARDAVPWRSWTADYRTAVGERRAVMLADGTQLMLDTGTALDVRFDQKERRVLLRSGEIYVATAHENAPVYRPFIINTAQGAVEALGTRFTVRQGEARSHVAVYEGAVSIQPTHASLRRRIDAGQQAAFSSDAIDVPLAADPDAAGWTRGLLIVEQMRLDMFLRELARYRPGLLRCDQAVAGLRVSGVFPLANTDRVLAALEQALPLSVHYTTRYWVTIRPR